MKAYKRLWTKLNLKHKTQSVSIQWDKQAIWTH